MDEEVSVTPNGTLDCHSVSTSQSCRSGIVYRNRHRPFSMWRPSTYIHAVAQNRRSKHGSVAFSEAWSESVSHCEKESVTDYLKEFGKKKWNTLVTVMVVQAKSLPQTSEKSSMYCKIRLGSEMYKTKSVSRSPHPLWKEQFQLHIHRDHLLKVSLWEKDKQKSFMGSCVVDLTRLDKERTHELHLELDDGFGEIQLCVTMCAVRDDPSCTIEDTPDALLSHKKKTSDIQLVGELHVTAVAARGLYSKPNAYCTLELHNQRVQTHSVNYTSEPVWNKRYVFDVYDITSTLDVTIKDSSLRSSFRNETLGKVSIPLFRVVNGELRWFALKDNNKRNSAKGNHPRILLQMSIVWNPVKAALRLFSPKEIKYSEKPRKFDLDVVYKNTIFVNDVFDLLHAINDSYMHLFEWDNQELSILLLTGWLVFWFYFKAWTIPLLLIAPFVFHFIAGRTLEENMLEVPYKQQDSANLLNSSERHDQNLTGKIKALPDISLNILANIELLTSLAERLYNLVTFKVPFLSYVTMVILLGASFAFYFIPFNYMMMGLGIYKFTRKYLNPNRTLNNDLVDFITRIPDNEIWKDWKELSVPEPVPKREHSKLTRSVSDTAAADFTCGPLCGQMSPQTT